MARQGGLKDYISWAGLAGSENGDTRPEANNSQATRPSNISENKPEEKPARSLPSMNNNTRGETNSGNYSSQIDSSISNAIASVVTDMGRLISDNKIAFESKYGYSLNDQREAYKMEHEKAKRNIVSIVESLNNNKINLILPKWKHRLKGNFSPNSKEVIGGKRLFTVVAWAVVAIIIRTRIIVRRRRVLLKEKNLNDLKLNMLFIADSYSGWLGKQVSVPCISIQSDTYVDFSKPVKKLSTALVSQRILQFKVRLEGFLRSIITGGLPPPHVIEFLIAFAEDKNYFSDSYLWDCEKQGLRFDEYGATQDTLQGAETLGKDNCVVCYQDKGAMKFVDGSRVKMMIRNFLVIRIVVAQLALSPWFKGTVNRPIQRSSVVVFNFRVLASVIYYLCCKQDPSLPSLVNLRHINRTPTNASPTTPGGDEDEAAGNPLTKLLTTLFFRSGQEQTGFEKAFNAEVEEELLQVHRDWFGPVDDLLRYLVPMSELTWLGLESADWIRDLAAALDEWLAGVVKAIIERKFETKDEIAEASGP